MNFAPRVLTPPYDGALADRPTPDRPPVDVLDLTDVAPLEDAPASDVVCSPTLGGTVTFGLDGGLGLLRVRLGPRERRAKERRQLRGLDA